MLVYSRKELIAVVTGAIIVVMSIKTLGVATHIEEIVVWTDSTTVLKWICSNVLCHKHFIGRRIKRIMRIKSFWKHVSSRHVTSLLNPADIASRGISFFY